MSFSIVTDSAANLPLKLLKQHGITAIPFTSYLNGEEFPCDSLESFHDHAYYDAIRDGARITTSQINPDRYVEYLQPMLERGEDILFVGVSSGISGSFASAQIACSQLKETFPDRTIRLVDSLSAALGEGLLVLQGARMRLEGLTLENTAQQLEKLRTRIYHLFTVDDLQHLSRSGRISHVVATKGSDEGKIVPSGKERGRRRVLQLMAQKYANLVSDAKNHLVAISHADCPQDAELLADMIRTACPPQDVIVAKHEPVTGGHIGPGALALFFFGVDGVRAF